MSDATDFSGIGGDNAPPISEDPGHQRRVEANLTMTESSQTRSPQDARPVQYLGDLPIAGALFRYTGEDTVNSELLAFITPWIVNQSTMSQAEAESYKETEMGRIEPVYTQVERARREGQDPEPSK